MHMKAVIETIDLKSFQVYVFTVSLGTAVCHYGSIRHLTFIPRCRLMSGLP